MLTLPEIKIEVDRLAAILGSSPGAGPTYGVSEDFARPHIEVNATYDYVIVERGQERDRKSFDSLDGLLEQIFDDITFGMAFSYELEHRIETQDCRVIGFAKQVELLERLNPDWAARETARHEAILRHAPFRREGHLS